MKTGALSSLRMEHTSRLAVIELHGHCDGVCVCAGAVPGGSKMGSSEESDW